jgi:hypothetical protein
MAQGFANCYGNDVMQAESAGLSPAAIIQPLTYEVMREKNVSLGAIHQGLGLGGCFEFPNAREYERREVTFAHSS